MPQPTPFTEKKNTILALLSQLSSNYTDASPKGSIDQPIASLISELNNYPSLVTTSSCSGRVSVFAEGSGRGAKGHGGHWLFVSHTPLDLRPDADMDNSINEVARDNYADDARDVSVAQRQIESGRWHRAFRLLPLAPPVASSDDVASLEDNGENARYIHFKFEPLILHILCASPAAANTLLQVAQQAGFRESGAMNVPSPASVRSEPKAQAASGEHMQQQQQRDGMVNVAVRTTGLGLDCIIGTVVSAPSCAGHDDQNCNRYHSLVSEAYLGTLLQISNARFVVNRDRMERFRGGLRSAFADGRDMDGCTEGKQREEGWEDSAVRRERKRAEGLKVKEMRTRRNAEVGEDGDDDKSEVVHSDLGLGLGLGFDNA